MSFVIEHINDVLAHVEGRSDFVVAHGDGYSVIDYTYAGQDTFDHPARVECRGLKFGSDGRLIARPFEKFFNIGERPHTSVDTLDFTQAHTIMEKLDGSMIHPAIVDNRLVLMTRMGRTDVARLAERHINRDLAHYCAWYLEQGRTPIFEFTAPDNRIVVNYPASALTLLAIRDNLTGAYADHATIITAAEVLGVPCVPVHSMHTVNGQEFWALARAVRGFEGFVVRFADGLTVKAKGDEYVLKHRAKESVLREKNVLALVLRGAIDDVLPLLDQSDRIRVENYRDTVMDSAQATARYVKALVTAGQCMDQRTFAMEHLRDSSKAERALAFQVRGGADPNEAVRDFLLKQCGSQSNVDSVRSIIRATFDAAAPANDNIEQRAAA